VIMSTNAASLFIRLRERYGLSSRILTLGVRGAVFDEHNRVLLVRHTYVRGWHIPGGGVEIGESPEAALRRELFEEARIRLTGPPLLHGIFFNCDASPRDHVLVYVVRAFSVIGTWRPDREIADARFVPLTELPADTSPSTQRRLDEIAFGHEPALTW
jgi:ADP-ribose pyrophosphatase YjhB (NUDIX family)